MAQPWNITFQVNRQTGDGPARFDSFSLEVNPDEYVLDAVERIWAFHDRSLIFRHACHHSVCGACGMRVNGVEKLTCITPIHKVTVNGGVVKIEPLRNFPVVGDLAVDMGTFYLRMEAVGFPQIVPLDESPPTDSDTIKPARHAPHDLTRLVDCIECGMCISACPVSLTTPGYLGPAVLAGAQHVGIRNAPQLLDIVDTEDGVWRCHSVYECTAVCPANVQPGWRIMDLRAQVMRARLSNLFNRKGWAPVEPHRK
jgi:succinate dehydrogenase / fumarate reductase iron-sulfur subunit